MGILDAINTIIVKINSVICNVRNLQVYIGTKDETSLETITGRLKALEAAQGINLFDDNGKIKCDYINKQCCGGGQSTWGSNKEWLGSGEWPAEDSVEQTQTEEW